MANDGATPDREDIPEQANNDPCIRFMGEEKVAMGKHSWIWEDLLKMRVCTTCGVRRPFTKRFEGQ